MSNIQNTVYTPATLYKFSGAGNDFVVIDGRKGGVDEFRTVERIGELCREYRTDGLMILTDSPVKPANDGPFDFVMEFYNPDGTGGMMCGNGGRCITAFADMLDLKPAAEDGTWHFLAPDGPHEAKILCHPQEISPRASLGRNDKADNDNTVIPSEVEESKWTVRLKMIDVDGVTPMMGGYFLNTGTRHFVKFVGDVDAMDMERDAKPLRWDPAFQPIGTNVNFVERREDGLHIRTYEKGVEGETLACGTGITASAIASVIDSPVKPANDEKVPANDETVPANDERGPANDGVHLQCRRGDWLTVEFDQNGQHFTNVYLTGPAELVAVLKNGQK